jgi:outer membrane murein-binding lipoprotein Lpp
MNKIILAFSLLLALTTAGCGKTETEKKVDTGNAASRKMNVEIPKLENQLKSAEVKTALTTKPIDATDDQLAQSITACNSVIQLSQSINAQAKTLLKSIDTKGIKYEGKRSDVVNSIKYTGELADLFKSTLASWETEKARRAKTI